MCVHIPVGHELILVANKIGEFSIFGLTRLQKISGNLFVIIFEVVLLHLYLL